jgi:hypothetical protein
MPVRTSTNHYSPLIIASTSLQPTLPFPPEEISRLEHDAGFLPGPPEVEEGHALAGRAAGLLQAVLLPDDGFQTQLHPTIGRERTIQYAADTQVFVIRLKLLPRHAVDALQSSNEANEPLGVASKCWKCGGGGFPPAELAVLSQPAGDCQIRDSQAESWSVVMTPL